MGEVIRLRRGLFVYEDRDLIRAASAAWSNALMPQTVEFAVTDEGEEYATIFASCGELKATIGRTKTGFFIDSCWFGYEEGDNLCELLCRKMPQMVREAFKRATA